MRRQLQLLIVLLLALPIGMLAQGTWQTATLISNGGSGNATLDKDHGEAWFKIEVPSDGRVKLTQSLGGNLAIYNVFFCWIEGSKAQSRTSMGYYPKDGQSMEVTDVAQGTYYVQVQRNGGEGTISLSYQFTASGYTNDEEPNNEAGSGTFIANGQTVQGHIGYLDDANVRDVDDWYKIEVTQDGRVDLIYETEEAYGLEFYRVNFDYFNAAASWGRGAYELRAGSSYYTKKDTLSIKDVGVGTYYINLHRNSGHGGYKLKYVFTPCKHQNDAEPNDNAGSGSYLTNGQTAEGHLGYLDGNDYRDKDDWYKIEVPQDGRVDLIYEAEETYGLEFYRIEFEYYNPAGSWGQGSYDLRKGSGYYTKKDTLTMTDVGVGTYYIHLSRNSGHGGYKLKYVFTPCKYQNDVDLNDELATGAYLTSGQTVDGHLGFQDGDGNLDKYDYYKIEVTEDGRVDLIYEAEETYGLEFYRVTVSYYDPMGNWGKGGYYDRAGSSYYTKKDTLSITDAGVGTYYILLSRNSGHGGYKLKYVFTPCKHQNDAEPNDEGGQGSEIAVGQAVQGHLGYQDGTSYRDTKDWYKIVVPRDGRVQIVYNCDQTYKLELYRVEFRRCKGENDYPVVVGSGYYVRNDTLTINDVAAGNYYVYVSRNSGHGGYILKYIFTPNTYRPDVEPNNELAEVKQELGLNKYLTGHMGYLDDQDFRDKSDWFKLSTNSSTTSLTVTVEAEPASNLEFYRVYIVSLKDGKTNTVAASSYYVHDPVTLTFDKVDPDATYYVHLERNKGHGGYTVVYGTSETPEPVDPEPYEQEVVVKDDNGNGYTNDPETGKTTLTEVKPDDKGDVYICRFPSNVNVKWVIIKKGAFDGVGNFGDVTVTQTTPPDFEDPNELKNHNPQNGTLHVPAGSKPFYENHPVWSQFGKIVEEGEEPGEEPQGETVDEFTMWYMLDIGGTVSYKLSEKPQVRLLGEETTVTSSRGVATFLTKDIWKFTLSVGSSDPVGIEETFAPVQTEAQPSISRESDALVFSGCRPGEPVVVYTTGGRLVSQYRIGDDGSLTLSLSSLGQGLYIVKAGSANIKIMKK